MNIFETEKRIEQQAQKALDALNAYKLEKYDRHVKHESLEELLYQMLEHIWFEEKTYQYQSNIVSLLSILLKPHVAEAMRQELTPMEMEDISCMLLKLYSFIHSISGEYYLLMLEMVEVQNCTDKAKLSRIEQKYRSKLRGCLAEQGDPKVKSINGYNPKIVDNEPA